MKRLVVLLLLSIEIANIDCKEIKKYSEENVHELKDIGLFYIDGEPSLSYYDFADFCISKGKFDLIMENNMDIYIKAIEIFENGKNASSDHSKKYSSFFNEAVIYMKGEEYAELIDLEDRFLSKFDEILTDEEKDSLISINVLTNDRNYMNEKIKNGEGDLPFVKFLQKSFKDIEETGDEYYFYKYLYERKPFLLDLLSE